MTVKYGVILWILIWLVASIVYRRSKGKPVFYKKPSSLRFRQTNASGKSHSSLLTRFMRANNCLVVQVTDKELDIHLHFPFNLLFLSEISRLEHRIPLSQVVSASIVKRLVFKKVKLAFTTNEGSSEEVSLWLKRPEDFLRALDKRSSIKGA